MTTLADFIAFIHFDRLTALPEIAIVSAFSALLVGLSYRRLRNYISDRNRWLLPSLRVIVIALLLFCMLEPHFVAKEIKIIRPKLVMLLDSSQSMSIKDVDSSLAQPSTKRLSRLEAVKAQLFGAKADGDGILKALSKKFDLSLYQFNSELSGLESPQALQARGSSTDISNAISKTAQEQRGEKLAGIVLISDGKMNVGGDPSPLAKQIGVPIYTVGVGNPKAPKDIQVIRVEAPPIVYLDRPFSINLLLKSSGYEGRNAQLRLFEGQAQVDSKLIALRQSSPTQNFEFRLKPQKEGDYTYTVSVDPLSDELTSENNKRTLFIKAVKSKLKLLYLDGAPRWEYRFLKRAMEKDESLEPTFILVSPADSYLASKTGGYYPQYPPGNFIEKTEKFPEFSKDLFRYDVIIIGNVSFDLLKAPQLQALADFVEKRGGGLLFLGGEASLGAKGAASSGLKKLLPVNVPSNGGVLLEETFNLVLTPDGFFHPIMRLSYSKDENDSIWRELPALKRAFGGLQSKAGASVLAKHQRYAEYPVIIYQRYGRGKVLLIATDTTWNWDFEILAYKPEASYYRQFWSQTIRWLATESEDKLVNLELDKQEYELGEEVEVSTRVYNQNYEPLPEAKVELTVKTPLGTTVEIPALSNPEVKGLYSANFQPTESGNYTLSAKASYYQLELGSDSKQFEAHYPKLEFEDPRQDEARLKSLSEISGGSYMTLAELPKLAERIRYAERTEEVSQKSELWNNPAILLLAVALLGGEWILRKRRGLV